MKKFIIIIFFISSFSIAHSQEMLGIVNSNFAGSNGVIINPSSIVNSKVYMDINLLSGDIFIQNNFLNIHSEDYHLGNFLQKEPVFPKYGIYNQSFDRYRDEKMRSAFVNIRLNGPSAMVSSNGHAFALHTAARAIISVNKMPYEIANFSYEGLNFPSQFNINYLDDDFRLGAMAWGEIGLTYANIFYKDYLNQWSAGITVKRLLGYSAIYLQADDIDYVVFNDSTIDIRNINAKTGFSLPINYDNTDFPEGKNIKGGGFGFDIGVSFHKKKRGYDNRKYRRLCVQPYEDYYYRVGVSLLDVGAIKFNDNAEEHVFENGNEYWERIDTLVFGNMHHLTNVLSNRLLGNPTASLNKNTITMMLPTALSFQFDYHYSKNIYFNSTFIYPIVFSNSYLQRPAQISITPRYESPEFEFSIPLSLYNWETPRIGIAARYHFLTIGTDKLGGFFGFNDFTGMDIYFSIKLNFRKGNCISFRRNVGCRNMEFGSK